MRSLVPALILALLLPSLSRADNLDASLATYAPQVVKYLKEKNCTNVGIFKFRVKKGEEKATLKAGPLNASMASRLENALILANDPKAPIGIIHDADHVAIEKKLPGYAKAEDRRKIFETRFPLAWGNETVTPHTFLTGQVSVATNKKSVNVVIEAFDRNAANTSRVVSFDVPVDRPLLCDLGESFALSRSTLRKKRSFEDIEEAASEDADQRDKSGVPPPGAAGPPSPTTPAPSTSSDEKLIDLEILYDDVKQTVAPDPANGGELRVAEPRNGQKVKIAFRNLTSETLGVVVMINGINSNRKQEGDPVQVSKWLPGPGERYVLEGFQLDEKNVQLWRVATDAETEALTYTENLGLISVYVFRTGKDLNIAKPDENSDEPPPKGMNISRSANLRAGMKSRAVKPATFAALQKEREDQTGLHLKPGTQKRRGAIIEDSKTKEDQRVIQASLPNPQLVMSMQIRYYKPKGR